MTSPVPQRPRSTPAFPPFRWDRCMPTCVDGHCASLLLALHEYEGARGEATTSAIHRRTARGMWRQGYDLREYSHRARRITSAATNTAARIAAASAAAASPSSSHVG